MNKVRFSTCSLIWRVNNYVSRQGKGLTGRNESTTTYTIFVGFAERHSHVVIQLTVI